MPQPAQARNAPSDQSLQTEAAPADAVPALPAPRRKAPRRRVSRPPAATDPFGPPPLIAGEDAAAYDAYLARATAVVAPADFLEEMWVRDVVDLAWEIHRLRRLKAQLMMVTADEGLDALLNRTMPWDAADALARRWAAREAGAIREVDALLRRTGLSREAVTARTLAV